MATEFTCQNQSQCSCPNCVCPRRELQEKPTRRTRLNDLIFRSHQWVVDGDVSFDVHNRQFRRLMNIKTRCITLRILDKPAK